MQRCVLDCQDKTKDKMSGSPNPSNAEVNDYKIKIIWIVWMLSKYDFFVI